MGGKIVGGAFAASMKPLVQHGRALTTYFGECHSHLQADLVAACQRHNLLSVISSMLLSLAMFLECSQVFWYFLRYGETITCEVTDRKKRGKATSKR